MSLNFVRKITIFDQNMVKFFFSPWFEAGMFLRMFLFFRGFQPGCSYKLFSYKKKGVWKKFVIAVIKFNHILALSLCCFETWKKNKFFFEGGGGGGSRTIQEVPCLTIQHLRNMQTRNGLKQKASLQSLQGLLRQKPFWPSSVFYRLLVHESWQFPVP